MNTIQLQKSNLVLTQLMLDAVQLNAPSESMAVPRAAMSIEEQFRKNSECKSYREIAQVDAQISKKPLFLKLSAVMRDSNCVSEEPETYFNGCSNDVSRISERVDMYQLLEDTPELEFSPLINDQPEYRPYPVDNRPETALSGLRPVLKELLLRNNIERCDAHLNGEETAILAAVIQKKVGLKMRTKQLYRVEELRINESLLPKRRAEECYKFIFKHAFKHLQARFVEAPNKAAKGKRTSAGLANFYAYYFGDVAQREQIDICNFYLPLTADAKGLNLKEVLAKTINTSYIALVCQSAVFIADLLRYLQTSFMHDYEAMIGKKIDKIVGKWESTYMDSFCAFKTVESICDFVVHNKKTKLPWFYSEVDEARRVVTQLVSKQQCALEL